MKKWRKRAFLGQVTKSQTSSKEIAIGEKLMSFEEYLDFEEKSEVKHEFDNGKLIEMPGGAYYHNKSGIRIGTLLNIFIDHADLNFDVLSSDQKVFIPLPN
jgi:Uma2 family endonuclease